MVTKKGLLRKISSEVSDFLFGLGGREKYLSSRNFWREFSPSEMVEWTDKKLKRERYVNIISQTSLTGATTIFGGLSFLENQNHLDLVIIASGLKLFCYAGEKVQRKINSYYQRKIINECNEMDGPEGIREHEGYQQL